ncbi:MAG: hypothetical protein PVG39_28225 [Desulfobacteraceae bacterium]|jgi:fructose-bisphosphate aldolase class 1
MNGMKTAEKVEDCFDGSMIYEITLYQSINNSFIAFLDNKGNLDYYADFPKPLFRLEVPGICQLTGCLGADTIRAVLYRNNIEKNLSWLKSLLASFQPDRKNDIS